MSITGIHLRGVHLGSFYNVNQPPPSGNVQVYNSRGQAGCKNVYFAVPTIGFGCLPYPSGVVIPGVPHINAIPGFLHPQYSVFFEARSSWDSVYDGLLINMSKRMTHNFSFNISYTWSHSIDDGPNPSFVLIPQDSNNGNFGAERASSADDARHRFVGNAILSSPKTWNAFARDFSFSMIVTLQSPQYFSKYAGFDANGDVFGNNDRVGGDPRNTFKGDTLKTVDVRLERTFPVYEKLHLQFLAEAFNLLNTRQCSLLQHELWSRGLLSQGSRCARLLWNDDILPGRFSQPVLRNAQRGLQSASASAGVASDMVAWSFAGRAVFCGSSGASAQSDSGH